MLKPIYENMPSELKGLPQWVNWKITERDGRMTKPPFQINGALAKSDDPLTWSNFDDAQRAAHHFDGVGVVVTDNDDNVFLDFDKCRCPAFDGLDKEISGGLNMVSPEVAEYIRRLNSYTELSPSGKGLHVFLKGRLPVDGKRKGNFEVYQSGRYSTMTGHIVEGFPRTIEYRQEALDAFYQEVFGSLKNPSEQEKPALKNAPTGDRNVILEKAFNSRSGDKIKRLWDGDFTDYPSQSEADLALCSYLAFWFNGDTSVIDAAFRESGLMREKWNEKHFSDGQTYGEATISKAIDGCQALYENHSSTGCAEQTEQTAPPSMAWPDPLDEAAFHGVIGDWVRSVSPNTEADPAALLFQGLVTFGNIFGRNPHFMVEATEHHCNEFLLLVGNTSKGRKGTSWDHARIIAKATDTYWESECIKSGLTSGEGLIYNVRDPQGKRGKTPADAGVADKRLVAYESEFANVLKIIERKDNTLSAVIRDAWDRGNLRTLAKNSPVKATGAHISIISHVTNNELMARLSETESFNGFANRFLFVCVKRSKLLPEGGGSVNLTGIMPRFQQAVEFAKTMAEMRRDEEARAIWYEIYEELTRDQPGILGSVLARDAAHVVRLSMIYALLDCSAVIRWEHLMAALACWEYIEASARYIFGSMAGDPMADKIYDAARQAKDSGITKTYIQRTLFQRNISSERIDQAIGVLKTMRKVRVQNIGTQGRPETRIFVTH